MRVGLVCPYSVSWPGGVQTHVLGLADELVRRGHVVRVLAPCDGVPPTQLVDPAGRSMPVPANGSVARLALGPRTWRAVSQWLGRRHLDVVHVHEPFSPLVSMVATAVSDAPIVGTFHAAAQRWWPYELAGSLLARVGERLSVRTAVSDAAEALAKQHFPGTYLRTPNAIDVSRIAETEPAADAPAVLFVGRNEPRKGAAVMVEAARAIDAEVGILGGGYEGSSLVAGAPPNVRFLGPLGDQRKAALLRGTRVFCAPSLAGESFGFVVLEAMAAGTAVVASDIPGYAGVLGDAGRLVRPGDAAALAAAVSDMLEDPGTLSALAFLRAEEFSWERVAGRVEEAYELAM